MLIASALAGIFNCGRRAMADASSTSNQFTPQVSIFKGEGYEHWSLPMKTILRSRDLWDLVYMGQTAMGEADIREIRKKDALTMSLIQQGVHDNLFSRIAGADTAKETWDILRLEFQGDSQVQSVKLQGLRRDFENLSIFGDESIGDYFSRVMNNVGQQRSYGEELTDQKIVENILRSLSSKFDYVIPSIEVVFDLSIVTPVKLMGLLQSQEERINSRLGIDKNKPCKTEEQPVEQALQAVHDPPRSFRGRGRGVFRGRGTGRGRGRFNKSKVPQCTVCKKFGHLQKDCLYNEDVQANVADQGTESDAGDTDSTSVTCL